MAARPVMLSLTELNNENGPQQYVADHMYPPGLCRSDRPVSRAGRDPLRKSHSAEEITRQHPAADDGPPSVFRVHQSILATAGMAHHGRRLWSPALQFWRSAMNNGTPEPTLDDLFNDPVLHTL